MAKPPSLFCYAIFVSSSLYTISDVLRNFLYSKKSRLLKINKRDWKCLDLYIAIAACTQFSYLLIKPLVLDRLHGNSYEISAYKEIQ